MESLALVGRHGNLDLELDVSSLDVYLRVTKRDEEWAKRAVANGFLGDHRADDKGRVFRLVR